jgi:uncharacterized membrane protein
MQAAGIEHHSSGPGITGGRIPSPALLLAGLIAIGIVLRFWHLGDWNFQATEMFTLRDSVRPQFHNSRPLGYLLNYYIVRPFLPLDEFGLRLLPAIFGVLTIPAMYFVGRRLLGPRPALFAALMVTFSHLMVMYSQLARYWSLVFLLCTIYPFALFIGVRERNKGALALGVVTGILAALAHPVSLLLLPGLALLLLSQLRRGHVASLWSQRGARWAVLFLIAAGAVAAWRFVPILQGWISMHDRNPLSGQFLLPSLTHGIKQVFYLLAFVEGLTLPLVLGSIAGTYILWRERDKPLAICFISVAVFPIAFLTLISIRTPVSQYYLLPATPVFFLAAGVFLDRLFQVNWGLRPAWPLPAAVAAMVLLVGVPTLASEYLNGRRYDFRSMARWLQERSKPGDVVFSDQPMVLNHYLHGTKVRHLRPDTVPLREAMQGLRQSSGTLWVVAPGRGHTFRTDLERGGLIDWIHENCQLRNITGKGRVDFRQQYLQVYRCPPMSSESRRAESVATP